MTEAIRSHPFAFPDAALIDLRERLSRTRWPVQETVDDWSQGAPLARMQALCTYWQDVYDWRACEERLNALDPSMTQIDGLDIHFLHLRSPEPEATPLVMTHGWPGSVIEFLKAAPLLVGPTCARRRSEGRLSRRAAHAARLRIVREAGRARLDPGADCAGMGRAHAAAWLRPLRRARRRLGLSVTNALGGIGAPAVEAVHFNMFPVFKTMEARDAQEESALKRLQHFTEHENGYQLEQVQSPQTIGYALTDSPVGQAAWLYEKYEQWTDHDGDPERVLSRDEMLDNITLYWLTATAATSARIYRQSSRTFEEHEIQVPRLQPVPS